MPNRLRTLFFFFFTGGPIRYDTPTSYADTENAESRETTELEGGICSDKITLHSTDFWKKNYAEIVQVTMTLH